MRFTGYFDDRNIEFEKLGENINEVNLSSAYDHNCSEQQSEVVTDEMLDNMIDSDNDLANKNRYDRRQRVDFPKNDSEAVEMGLIVPSAEAQVIGKYGKEDIDKVKNLIAKLTAIQRRRLYYMFDRGLTYEQIAEIEGVTHGAVRDSIKAAMNRIQKHGEFLLKMRDFKWIDLLVCTNI